MARKYTRYGEEPVAFECTKRKCKWQGDNKQKAERRIDGSMKEFVCPNCGNNEFYGLLNTPEPACATKQSKL